MNTRPSHLLSLAHVQMAAESVFLDKVKVGSLSLVQALVDGNNHASRFPKTLAETFSNEWAVVAHQPDATTGFSGTLFQ